MRTVLQCVAVCWLVILAGCAARQAASESDSVQYVETDTGRWLVHDVNRPAPPVISPGSASTQNEPGKAPSDAIVLFDGTDQDGLLNAADRRPGSYRTAIWRWSKAWIL